MPSETTRLEKTDKAREALTKTRAGSVSMIERRILILANGKRDIDEIAAVLGGSNVVPAVRALIDKGFLTSAPEAAPEESPAPQEASHLAPLLRGAALIRRAIGEPPSPPPQAAPAKPRAPDTAVRSGRSSKESLLQRAPPPRSIIAAKTHIIDLLVDHGEAGAETIRAARGSHKVALTILAQVRALHRAGQTALRDAAIALLDPLLPEEYLPALHAIPGQPPGGDDDAGQG